MEQAVGESVVHRRGPKRLPLLIAGITAGVLCAAFLSVCAIATYGSVIWPHTTLLGVEVGGLHIPSAAQKIGAALPDMELAVYPYDQDGSPSREGDPEFTLPLEDLYPDANAQELAENALSAPRSGGFLANGAAYLHQLVTGESKALSGCVSLSGEQANADAKTLVQKLTLAPADTAYQLGKSTVDVTVARNGRALDQDTLVKLLSGGEWAEDLALDVPYASQEAKVLSAQDIYDAVSGEVKNAGWDAASGAITPEQVGAEFDVTSAQKLLDDAAPGAAVQIPATIEYPKVTAQELKGVLFRDVLGTYTTHVGGSAARISNVKLASASVNGAVLNSGDVFSYNTTVGQRTLNKGYQAAPAYVKGETVDEVGGGVCQPSSTLYLACLLANLEIVQRSAHRYVPAYVPKGMDATVSWGGPDYQFRNDTDYPIRISAVYSKGYLTMKLIGTKTDGTYVKMTNKVLSTTDFKTVYQEDDTIPAGTEQVKVTPYTGYKVQTFRNLYSKDGSLISSKLEATSDYKVRDKLILQGPKKASASASGSTSEIPAETGSGTGDAGTANSGAAADNTGEGTGTDTGAAA